MVIASHDVASRARRQALSPRFILMLAHFIATQPFETSASVLSLNLSVMSRHRHVRNIRLDDYDDSRYLSDDPLSDDDPPDDQTSAYLWNPPSPPPPQPSVATTPNDDLLLSDLTIQFRTILNDPTLQSADIDAAVLACQYDVEAALTLLREQVAEKTQRYAAIAVKHLEKNEPSPIGELVGEQVEEQTLQMPRGSSAEVAVEVQSGNALRVDGGEKVVPFAFDRPSPDDLVRMKQGAGGKRARALRMPRASALRGAAKKEESVEVGGKEREPGREEKGQSEFRGKQSKRENGEREGHKVSDEVHANELPNQDNGKPDESKIVKNVKQRLKPLNLSRRVQEGCRSVSVVVAGHVDAGKSTLMGHLFKQVGLDEVFEERKGKKRREEVDLAWATDVDQAERDRGVTIDIATRVFKRGNRLYAMIDAPGHRDFVPAMILGACQASAALLVLDASPGEFEAGFSEEGQTREHALVLKSLGVDKLIIVVNKMDVVECSKERYQEIVKLMSEFLKGNGWKTTKNVIFLPASGREGLNLVEAPGSGHRLSQWYDGKTVLQAIEGLPSPSRATVAELSTKPTRLVVSNQFRSESLGGKGAVTGRLLCGSIAPKDKLAVCPGATVATVKTVEMVKEERSELVVAGVDSLPVSLGLMDLEDGLIISPGSVLCDPEAQVQVASEFRAQIVTLTTATPLIPGTRGVLHIGGGAEAAAITKLIEYTGSRKGSAGKKKRPRRLIKGDTAVVEMKCNRGVAMEKFNEFKALGRFALRQEARTVAVGIVLEVLKRRADVARSAG